MHLAGEFAIKSWLFSLSTKGKNSRNFAKVRSQHLPQENSASCLFCLATGCSGIFSGSKSGRGLENVLGGREKFALGKKMRARMVSPPVTCTM